jgi:hypothetical protein
MRNLFLAVVVFFTCQFSNGQGLPSEYQKAKTALQSKDYWEAINGFKQLTDPEKYGNLASYASFYLAEAALGANQPAQAISALQPIYGKNWNKSDEARYLLATAYFRNNQNVEALKVINTIKNDGILQQAYNLSYEYLKSATSSFLVANLSEFKTNEGYAAALATVLQNKSIMSASEMEALNQVRTMTSKKNTVSNDVLDIVVILPFTGTGSSSVAGIGFTDFMFELFQGIETGVEQLKKEGQRVNLTTFDSKRDVEHLKNLLKDQVLSNADVIIGPIYPEETDVVSAFAEKEQIPFIHPLSNLGDRFEQFKYSYLFRPSVASLSVGVISSLKSQKWGKRVAIGYSGSSRDENLGLLLQANLVKEGFQVVKIQKLDSRNASSFLQDLGIRVGNNPSVDQVILLSDDPAIAQSVFSLLESISTSVPMLVMDSWLGFNFANFEMLEFPNFYFIANNTPKFDPQEMKDFRAQFYSKYYSYPGMNSILGAELVNWIGSNSKSTMDYNLRRSLDQKSFQPGKLTWGFNFQNSNNNSYTPVFRLESGELIPLH